MLHAARLDCGRHTRKEERPAGTRLALTYAIVLLLMLGILYEGYSTLSQIAAQAPQFQATISGAQTGMLVMGVLALLLGLLLLLLFLEVLLWVLLLPVLL